MTLPLTGLKVFVGFEQTSGFATPFQLDSSTYGKLNTGTLGGVRFVDLSAMVQSVSVSRGRNRQLQQFTAGTASIRFYDPTRILDPLNASSPYYPFAGPRNPVRVVAYGVVIYDGLVTDWDLDYGKTDSGTITTAVCSDALTVLANSTMNAWTPTAQKTGARVNAVLGLSEVSYQGARAIDAGVSTLGAFAVEQGTNTLSYLQAVTDSEQGLLFVSREGAVTFKQRPFTQTGFGTYVLADNGAGNPYTNLINEYGDELLFNYMQLQSPAGAVQTASNAASVARYQTQPYSNTGLLNSTTAEISGMAEFLLSQYAAPKVRFTAAEALLNTWSDAETVKFMRVDLGFPMRVIKSFEAGSPSPVTKDLIVTGIAHDIRPGAHKVRFAFEDYSPFQFILNSDTFGKLNTNVLSF